MAQKIYLFGLHTVLALLNNQPERVIRLFLQHKEDKKTARIVEQAKKQQIPIEYVSAKELDKLAPESNHQGVVAFCAQAKIYDTSDLKSMVQKLTVPAFILVLDGVQDPHNLGACFRSADAAGVHAIIAPKDKSVGLTPAVSKVASGAVETIPFVQVTNLVRALELLKELNVWIFGADEEAQKTIYETDLAGSAAIVMGAEGTGLRRLTREHCDVLMKIPMHGTVSSLNVSVATGVILFETVRQRMIKMY